MRTRLIDTSIREVELTQEDVERIITKYLEDEKMIFLTKNSVIQMMQAPPSIGSIKPVKDPQGVFISIVHEGEAKEWEDK